MTPKTILIIEDDPVLLRGLKDNFEAQGYQVRTAKDGQKGLDAFNQPLKQHAGPGAVHARDLHTQPAE